MMHPVLLFFEFLGTTELLVIALAALVLFGPRKLPEIGRTVGKGIAEFKRASDDFKRTWEFEVELERRKPALDTAGAAETNAPVAFDADGAVLPSSGLDADEQTIARTKTAADDPANVTGNLADEGAWDVATGRAATPAAPTARADEDEINAS